MIDTSRQRTEILHITVSYNKMSKLLRNVFFYLELRWPLPSAHAISQLHGVSTSQPVFPQAWDMARLKKKLLKIFFPLHVISHVCYG